MLLATVNGMREAAQPGGRGHCPACRGLVIAKCGVIVTHHWAHEASADCDPWAEPDSVWHAGWQEAVPPERREVVIGAHRADVIASDGRVVELQHSSISPAEITERENFYGPGMVWLFDAIEATEDDRLLLRRQPGYRTRKHHGTGYSFRWKHARKTITWCSRPVLIDVGDDEVLWLMKMGSEPPVGGYGWMFNADYVRYWMKG